MHAGVLLLAVIVCAMLLVFLIHSVWDQHKYEADIPLIGAGMAGLFLLATLVALVWLLVKAVP